MQAIHSANWTQTCAQGKARIGKEITQSDSQVFMGPLCPTRT